VIDEALAFHTLSNLLLSNNKIVLVTRTYYTQVKIPGMSVLWCDRITIDVSFDEFIKKIHLDLRQGLVRIKDKIVESTFHRRNSLK
jgi:hypothetical protein